MGVKNVCNYHQFIWNIGKKFNMQFANFYSWKDKSVPNIYEDINLFQNIKHSIHTKYKKIFIDIDNDDKPKNIWREILKKYFLDVDGEIFLTSISQSGKSLRLNSSITKIINSFKDWNIKPNQKNGKSLFVITNNHFDLNTLVYFLNQENGQVTILGWELKDLRKIINEKKDISFHRSFPTEQELENQSDLEKHWVDKKFKLDFNPIKNKLNISTIESFRGLESEIVFLILTPNMPRELIISAISRTKEKLYIFDFGNREYLSQLKLNVDEVVGINEYRDKIYISLSDTAKKNILWDFFKKEYQEFKDDFPDLIDRYLTQFQMFFKHIFSPYEKLIFVKLEDKDDSLIGITTKSSSAILKVRKDDKNHRDFFINRVEKKEIEIESKTLNINYLEKELQLSCEDKPSNHKGINSLILEVMKLTPNIPIQESPEYQNWYNYLEIQQKQLEKEENKLYSIVDIEYYNIDNNISKFRDIESFDKNKFYATFKSPDIQKFSKNKYLIFQDKKHFGKIVFVKNKSIYVEIKYENKQFTNTNYQVHIQQDSQNKNLQKALRNISQHEFRFYLFRNHSLKPLDNIKDEKDINWLPRKHNLNYQQKEAVLKALASNEIFMIQGPPGTGKTSVISEIAYQETLKGKKVLITSESNDAIENAIERLSDIECSDDYLSNGTQILYPLIHQGEHRKNTTNNIHIDFPIESNTGKFYKKRILCNLNNKINTAKKNQSRLDLLKLECKNKIQELNDEYQIVRNLKYLQMSDIEEQIKRNKSEIYQTLQDETEKIEKYSVFTNLQEEFKNEFEKKDKSDNVLQELQSSYLNNVNIIGATLAKVGGSFQKDNKKFDIAIIDEVSKATPVLLNFAILKAKKVILVGDHKQLPPMLNFLSSKSISKNDIENLSSKYHEDLSLEDLEKIDKRFIQELQNQETIFEKLFTKNPKNSIQLVKQYRMHEDIQKAINRFYDKSLECGTDKEKLKSKHKLFDGKNLVWVNYDSKYEETEHNPSYSNQHEKEKIEQILEKLNLEYKDIGFKPTIGVISFYGKQVSLLSEIGKKNIFTNLNIDFGTVDTFQGQERDFIIVSMVRSNQDKNMGFAQSFNRINVAFSRAKQLLVIVGNKETFIENSRRYLSADKKEKDQNIRKIYKEIYELSHKGTI